MPKSKEPPQLSRGKKFHKLIQDEWKREAQGDITPERYIIKPSGRRGRVDVFVNGNELNSVVAIVEIKATDWDRMTDKAVKRNARRQIRQIWNYIESQILEGKYVESGEGKDICPGIIFPKRPKNKDRMKEVEEIFIKEGIPVVWHDESIEEVKKRNGVEG